MIAHKDSKGCAIRQGAYSLEVISLPQDRLTKYLFQGRMSTKISQKVNDTLRACSAS
jgi:hypothetical protein